MPNPTRGDKVDSILTAYSQGWIQDVNNYAFLKAFPIKTVERQSDKYYVWDQADMMRTDAKIREPGMVAPLKSMRLSNATYYANLYAISKAIDDTNRKNFSELDLAKIATEACMQDVMIRLEKNFVANYMAASTWTTDWDGVGATPSTNEVLQFDVSGATPITDIISLIGAAEDVCGLRMNKCIMGKKVFDAVRNNSETLDRVKYTQRGVVTEELLAQLLGLDEVIVSYASENTANEGLTGSYSPVMGKDLLVYHVDDSGIVSGDARANAGTVFACNGIVEGMNDYGVGVFNFRDEARHSDIIEVWGAHDFKVTGAGLGGFIDGAVS